jgi:hypothetical protein
MRPTELAHATFQVAADSARRAMESKDAPEYIKNLAHAVANMADGLDSLATGLRATYMSLEQVKAKIK